MQICIAFKLQHVGDSAATTTGAGITMMNDTAVTVHHRRTVLVYLRIYIYSTLVQRIMLET